MLEKLLKEKTVVINNTEDEQGLPFALAHVVRDYAKLTVCVDKKYKMKKETNNFRVIEYGKVILAQSVENIPKYLIKKVDFEIWKT